MHPEILLVDEPSTWNHWTESELLRSTLNLGCSLFSVQLSSLVCFHSAGLHQQICCVVKSDSNIYHQCTMTSMSSEQRSPNITVCVKLSLPVSCRMWYWLFRNNTTDQSHTTCTQGHLPLGLGLAASGRVWRRRVAGTISGGRCRKSLRYWIPSLVRYQ